MRSSATSRASPSLRCRRRTVAAPDRRAAAAVVAARPPGTAVGYLLIDLETGQVLAELNPDLPLIPASTAKLATAVAALDVLGPEHRFSTELLARGALTGGVLHGDLILRGGGDPFLDLRRSARPGGAPEEQRHPRGRRPLPDRRYGAAALCRDRADASRRRLPTIRASARSRSRSTAFIWRGGAAVASMPRRCRH